MGILLSVVRYLRSKADEEEIERPRANAISSPDNSYNYYPNTGEKSEYNCPNGSSHQWWNGNYYRTQSYSYQMENLTVSLPNLRLKSSLAHTSVNHENIKISPVFMKENTSENVRLWTEPSSRGKLGEEKEKEQGEQVKIKCRVAAPPSPEVRRIKHYSSSQRILLVGEGDFSFSTCLAAAFGWASNMVATSLNSKAFLVQNYGNALSNLVELSIRKCKVMHGVDATKMANHEFLGGIKFDCIIFNFPFAGFFKDLSRESQLRRQRRLVSLFLKNAKEMLSENGEIHMSHKTNGFHSEWKVESLASSHRLRLIEAVDFNLLDYPGYNTKRGFGGDDNFDCYPSKTYKFGLKL